MKLFMQTMLGGWGSFFSNKRCRISSCIALFCLATLHLQAASLWEYAPQRVGRVLQDGKDGWMTEYTLGMVNAGPEFMFPLNLVYLNTRAAKGLFGTQWFCPQLESSLLPRDQGVLVWTQPSGTEIEFLQVAGNANEYASKDGEWRLRIAAGQQIISGNTGWVFVYEAGCLQSVASPTNRRLEFQWKMNALTEIRAVDGASGATFPVLTVTTDEKRRVLTLELAGQSQTFTYGENHLETWHPMVGNAVRFTYHPTTGVLKHLECGAGTGVDFVTQITQSPKDGTSNVVGPALYRLVSDERYTYTYNADTGKNRVTMISKTGRRIVHEVDYEHGVVIETDGKITRKTCFYRAPGRKYDGKLQRVEENGRLMVEHFYDRRTGLLELVVNADGFYTFFDYPAQAGHKPFVRGQAGAASCCVEPIGIRQGIQKDSKLVATMTYDDFGRLVAQTNALGQGTVYGYSLRGDLVKITDPVGGHVDLTHDAFGRVLTMDRNGIRCPSDQIMRLKI